MPSIRCDGHESLQMTAAPPIDVQTVKFKRACVLACSSLNLQHSSRSAVPAKSNQIGGPLTPQRCSARTCRRTPGPGSIG